MPENTSDVDESNIATTSGTKNVPGETKVKNLKKLLENDIVAADIRWSIFVAACQSYRSDSCLKPYPKQFITDGTKNMDALREVLDKTKSLSLLKKIVDLNFYKGNEEVVDLLHWVLIESPEPRFKNIPKNSYEMVMKLVPSEKVAEAPNLIFQMVWSPESSSEMKWNELTQTYGTFFAFHGSRLENFFSILHCGLQQLMKENSLFRKGIYLSRELTVSLRSSPSGYGWGKSIHGSELSCVAVCEVIDHPAVKWQDKGINKKCKLSNFDSSQAMTTDSNGVKVPNKYCLVLNSEFVRVRYLLVYYKEIPYQASSGVVTWLKNHKALVFILSYVVMLTAYHNPLARQWWDSLLRKFNFSE